MDAAQAINEIEDHLRKMEMLAIDLRLTKAEEYKLQTIHDKVSKLCEQMHNRRMDM